MFLIDLERERDEHNKSGKLAVKKLVRLTLVLNGLQRE